MRVLCHLQLVEEWHSIQWVQVEVTLLIIPLFLILGKGNLKEVDSLAIRTIMGTTPPLVTVMVQVGGVINTPCLDNIINWEKKLVTIDLTIDSMGETTYGIWGLMAHIDPIWILKARLSDNDLAPYKGNAITKHPLHTPRGDYGWVFGDGDYNNSKTRNTNILEQLCFFTRAIKLKKEGTKQERV